MPINAGDAGCTTGLSAKLYSDWTGDTANNGLSSPLPAGAQTLLKSQCFQIATGLASQLAAEAVFARYHTAAAQSIPNAANTVINFDTQDADTDGAVTTGTGWKFTVPAGKGGLYLVTADVGLNSAAALGALILTLLKNGSEFARMGRMQNANNGIFYWNGSQVVSLAAGDNIQVALYQSSGSTQPLESSVVANWVSITRLVGF